MLTSVLFCTAKISHYICCDLPFHQKITSFFFRIQLQLSIVLVEVRKIASSFLSVNG
jgi:hypothetical protein